MEQLDISKGSAGSSDIVSNFSLSLRGENNLSEILLAQKAVINTNNNV